MFHDSGADGILLLKLVLGFRFVLFQFLYVCSARSVQEFPSRGLHRTAAMPLFAMMGWQQFPYRDHDKADYLEGKTTRRVMVIASIMDNALYSPTTKLSKVFEVVQKWNAMDRVFERLQGHSSLTHSSSEAEIQERLRLERMWDEGIYAEFMVHLGEPDPQLPSSSISR